MIRNTTTGRWYRIDDSEAHDKVGHAIRKAVQRLQDTKPKTLERLRKECSANLQSRYASLSGAQKKAAKEDLHTDLAKSVSDISSLNSDPPSKREPLSSDEDTYAKKVSPKSR